MKWLKLLLRKFRKPVVFSPPSTWPDLLDPYQYQNKLMLKFEEQNTANHRAILEKVAKGAKITFEGKIEGPYTTRVRYELDDGSGYDLLWRSSLHWVDPLFPS